MFDRNQVAGLMLALGVDAEAISGHMRSTYPARVLDFDTFETLADPVDYFMEAMRLELEHGTAGGPATNVSNDDVAITARIAAAHLMGVEHGEDPADFRPFPTYYDWLLWVERLHSDALDLAKIRSSPERRTSAGAPAGAETLDRCTQTSTRIREPSSPRTAGDSTSARSRASQGQGKSRKWPWSVSLW